MYFAKNADLFVSIQLSPLCQDNIYAEFNISKRLTTMPQSSNCAETSLLSVVKTFTKFESIVI